MRHVKRSEDLDSIDSVEPAPSARGRVPARAFKALLVVALATALGGSAYFFGVDLIALWSPTTVVTEQMRMALGGGVAVLVLALSVLLPAVVSARRARKGSADESEVRAEAPPAASPMAGDPLAGSAVGPSPEEMMLSLESELSAAAAELAAELERAANAGVPVDPYAVEGTEQEDEIEAPPASVIVAVDPPQALAAIPIPVWVEVPDEPVTETPDSADSIQVDPIRVDPLGSVEPDHLSGESPLTESRVPEAVVDETPDADGNTNPTVRVLQAQIRSLEEALFRQSAAEAHPVEPQPELPRAATRDEVTREVLTRVRHTIRGLGVRMDGDPAAADVLARVEAAVDRLAETGFFVRPTLTEPDLESLSSTDEPTEPRDPLTDERADEFQAPAENWGSAEAVVVSTEVAGEFAASRTATAVIDDRPLAERLAAEVVLEEPESPEPVAEQADVVLPVPAGPPAPTVHRGRRWRRGTPAA
jgi:hypothetical protein